MSEKRGDPPIVETGEQGAEAIAETHFAQPPEHGASAVRAVKLNLRASLILQVLNMISGIELARGLGLTGRGELAAAMLWPTVFGAISYLGLEESMTYHVAQGRDRLGRLLGSALMLCTIQAVVFTALTVGTVLVALQRQDSETITAGVIYSLYVTLGVYGIALNGTLNGLHRYRQYNWVRLSIGILLVGSQTVLLIVGAFDVKAIVIGFVGCYVVSGVFVWTLVRRAYPGRLEADVATARTLFSYGVRASASTASNLLNQRLDQLVIAAFLSAAQLGLYVVAVTFTLFTPLVGGSIAVAALPNVAALASREERIVLARRLVSLTLLSSVVLSVPIIALAPYLIELFFGSEFTAGADITRILAVASIVLSTNRSLEAVLRGVGRPGSASVAEGVALAATVVGLAAMLPTLGLIGAAWASLFAYSVAGIWMVVRIRSLLELPVRRLLTPDREALALLGGAVRRIRARISGGRG